jgi:ketosteroid isomerase-like protein
MSVGSPLLAGCAAALFCVACATPAPPSSPESSRTAQQAVDELIAADRAFGAAGGRAAGISVLAAMFAPDVAMPLPGGRFAFGADEAIAALSANADNLQSRLTWQPMHAGVSADGEHGYTWGYMTRTKPDGTEMPWKYLAYWVKRPEGWRVAAYKRRPGAAGAVSTAAVAASLPPRAVAPSHDAALIEAYRSSLDATERAFSADAQVIGLGVAFTRYGSADAVNMGGADDAQFIVGSAAIGMAVSRGKPWEPSTLAWAPDRTIVASSGDLGVTLGVIVQRGPSEPGAPARFAFFTVWRRDDPESPWRYIAE